MTAQFPAFRQNMTTEQRNLCSHSFMEKVALMKVRKILFEGIKSEEVAIVNTLRARYMYGSIYLRGISVF